MKTYHIKEYGITVKVPDVGASSIVSELATHFIGVYQNAATKPDDDLIGMVDAIEALILGHASAGIDVSSPAYVIGLRSALDAIANNV